MVLKNPGETETKKGRTGKPTHRVEIGPHAANGISSCGLSRTRAHSSGNGCVVSKRERTSDLNFRFQAEDAFVMSKCPKCCPADYFPTRPGGARTQEEHPENVCLSSGLSPGLRREEVAKRALSRTLSGPPPSGGKREKMHLLYEESSP